MSQAKPTLVSLTGRGWSTIAPCIAVVRLHDQPGIAVGVQDRFRSGGVGRVWPSVRKARRRATYLAALHNLPIIEAL